MFKPNPLSRRAFLQQLAILSGIASAPARALTNNQKPLITRAIPSTGQFLPVIGMGTWISFNVGNDIETRIKRTQVLKTFFDLGGQLVDSSPMYGSAEDVIGFCLNRLGSQAINLFSATKVWTSDTEEGKSQIIDSHRLWGLNKFNLLQIHNLVNWQSHLDTLQQMKSDGKLQYIGITTSHTRRHSELEQILKTQPIDFVQLTYHLNNRAVEKRLLPLALEKGIAVIVNRPFSGGHLFDRYERHVLPTWANEIGCKNWAQFFLKFVISHPAVTCAIPATSRVDHMVENMGAGEGLLPDHAMRLRMLSHIQSL